MFTTMKKVILMYSFFVVLPEFEPTSFIKLMYDDKPVVNAGDIIYPHQAINPPHVWFPAPNEDAHYTLVLVDADAHVPLVRHWVVENVPGKWKGSRQG